MTKYQQFLNSAEIISEDLFNDVVNSLPECDLENISFDDTMCLDSQDYIAECIISEILNNWRHAFVEDTDFENKTFSLCDVDSLEDLEEIKETFSKWTITNCDDIVKQLTEEDNEDKEFESLINKIRFNATIEQLRKFVDSL